ncbi:MAG: hypothetical protein KIT72_13755 [Polyangiaceae bacterium]|nr:hypothetical protein [Polyangiaceae bacterium]
MPTRDGGGAYVPERSVCTARCRNHSDCPSFCDYQTGLCTTALAGADLGTTCSADSDCQGACRGGRCAQHCTVGDFEMGACGSGLSKPQAAACLGSVTPLGGAAPGLGDGLGECYQLCDCSSPCRGSTDICYNLSQLVTVPGGPVAYWGRAGVCFPASATVNADPLSCP